ncbi:hypothetical protein NNA36_10775 [Shimia sp. CNT1-13L.2]|jgi:hypothetical protein|uniref:hypothetical protein n=1 Tax=Shimia sp. CNT1-13L.2 TaxID=2959663 RepID=UPI0020CDB34F|nr:hypothetical protein [Shimia sp. CNT1-13L.2]MCP9482446.1 hypothetical protein [Shimia sp. CNT1-13L.2]
MKNTCFALALACALPTFALAQQLEQWGTAGGWDVMIDPSMGDGCLIQAEYTDGSVVRIGFDRNVGEGYVTAFNMEWGDIIEGEQYGILFDLDGAEYDAVATGIYLNDVPGADIYFDNVEFFMDIANRYTMTIYNENGYVTAIDLGGTQIGLEAVLECQAEMG